jgi:hypothetical protein
MQYSRVLKFFMQRFRKRRLRSFRELFPVERCGSILDIGGTADIWDTLAYESEITILNTDPRELPASGRYRTVVGDGCTIPFPDRSFDLAFSNSVIEHVGGWSDMQKFARELQRVGRSFYCQTPNKWFPVEPHLGTLFFHWWPWLLNHYCVVRYLSLWGLMNRPRPDQVKRSLGEIRLLNRRELRQLFPEAEIITERFLLLPKSFIAVRRVNGP